MIDSLTVNWVYHFPILPNGGKNWTRTSNIEVGHILTIRFAEEVGLEPTDKFSMCKINSLVRLPIPPLPQGLPLYSAAVIPDCKIAFRRLKMKLV